LIQHYKTHAYQVIKAGGGRYQAVKVLSEHDSYEDALDATLTAMEQESEEIEQQQVAEMREQGINVVTLKEAIRGMSPEQLARFNEERNKKFINPILDGNMDRLERMRGKIKNESMNNERVT